MFSCPLRGAEMSFFYLHEDEMVSSSVTGAEKSSCFVPGAEQYFCLVSGVELSFSP